MSKARNKTIRWIITILSLLELDVRLQAHKLNPLSKVNEKFQ